MVGHEGSSPVRMKFEKSEGLLLSCYAKLPVVLCQVAFQLHFNDLCCAAGIGADIKWSK
jgi:hypothetical protein